MTTKSPAPAPLTTKLPGGLELRWSSVAVLAILAALLAFVWHSSSAEERLRWLAILVPIALGVQALMRRVIGLQAPAPSSPDVVTVNLTAPSVMTGTVTELPATKPQRRPTIPPPAARVSLVLGLGVALAGCGAGTITALRTAAAVVKPVGVLFCVAARETEQICERHGAYGPATPASSGGEDETR